MKKSHIYILIGSIILLGLASIVLFIKTAGMAKPVHMDLNMPKAENDATENTSESYSTITILLLKNDQAYCYHGADKNGGQLLPVEKIRGFIVDEFKKMDDLTVLIKPSEEATYKNTVDVLDEMTINNIGKFKIIRLTKDDLQFIQTMKQ